MLLLGGGKTGKLASVLQCCGAGQKPCREVEGGGHTAHKNMTIVSKSVTEGINVT